MVKIRGSKCDKQLKQSFVRMFQLHFTCVYLLYYTLLFKKDHSSVWL